MPHVTKILIRRRDVEEYCLHIWYKKQKSHFHAVNVPLIRLRKISKPKTMTSCGPKCFLPYNLLLPMQHHKLTQKKFPKRKTKIESSPQSGFRKLTNIPILICGPKKLISQSPELSDNQKYKILLNLSVTFEIKLGP